MCVRYSRSVTMYSSTDWRVPSRYMCKSLKSKQKSARTIESEREKERERDKNSKVKMKRKVYRTIVDLTLARRHAHPSPPILLLIPPPSPIFLPPLSSS